MDKKSFDFLSVMRDSEVFDTKYQRFLIFFLSIVGIIVIATILYFIIFKKKDGYSDDQTAQHDVYTYLSADNCCFMHGDKPDNV